MLKILVANQNGEQNLEYCKFLKNKNEYDIKMSTDAVTTLKTYKKIEPNILILDSNFSDTTELIDKVTALPNEKNKCNIILTIDSVQQVLELRNFTKIKQILYKPINYNELIKEVNLMKEEFEIQDISDDELNYYLLSLHFIINSNGCRYLKSDIWYYYYYPNKFNSLDEIFKIVANEYDINNNEVRESIRSALVPLNTYRDNIDHKIMKMFDKSRNITPKYFLDTFVTYLKLKKK